MSKTNNPDDLVSRWSKRRDAVAREEADGELAAFQTEIETLPEPETEEQAMALLSESDPELAEKIAAIDVDDLKYEDDFTIFMSKRVPEIIRRRALSKLWLSDPVLANVDGLNDYDEDFTAAGDVIRAFKSAWEPGRGYAKPEEELAEISDDELEEQGENEVAIEADAIEVEEELASDEQAKPGEGDEQVDDTDTKTTST